MSLMMLSLLLLGAAALALALRTAPRGLTDRARRALASDRDRWAAQTGLAPSRAGLSGRWDGVDAELTDQPRCGVLLRCATEVEIASLEVFVNARLVPLGFTFIRPDARGPSRWALARREHLPLLRGWLADEALFSALATFLQGRRARLRGGWLELEHPGRPEDITPALSEVAALAARLRAAWWAPRRALAARWSLRFARPDSGGGGWQLHGRLGGAPVWAALTPQRGSLSLTLPHAPPGLVVTRRDGGGGGGPADATGNPLLDHLLAVRCPAPRDFLHDPGLSAALLAAVHGIPGAAVRAGSLTIEDLPDDPDRIDAVLACLVELVAAWASVR